MDAVEVLLVVCVGVAKNPVPMQDVLLPPKLVPSAGFFSNFIKSCEFITGKCSVEYSMLFRMHSWTGILMNVSFDHNPGILLTQP